ncbi:unnamed protein product [Caenorhabditis angaria]|uniref:Uncharacterized protein n=1 Tax=Caenorhabditis angaria TaxID=860376 RepID=A0A9P1N7A0_9PELO|nr:unnamed protein product [Caenorhabditis angaria]
MESKKFQANLIPWKNSIDINLLMDFGLKYVYTPDDDEKSNIETPGEFTPVSGQDYPKIDLNSINHGDCFAKIRRSTAK